MPNSSRSTARRSNGDIPDLLQKGTGLTDDSGCADAWFEKAPACRRSAFSLNRFRKRTAVQRTTNELENRKRSTFSSSEALSIEVAVKDRARQRRTY
jgi:hypothetical protein